MLSKLKQGQPRCVGRVGLSLLVSVAISGCSTDGLRKYFPSYINEPVQLTAKDVATVEGESRWDYFSRLQQTLLMLDDDRRGRALKYSDPYKGVLVQAALNPQSAVQLLAATTLGDYKSVLKLEQAYRNFWPVYERYQQANDHYPREFGQEWLDVVYIQAFLSRALSDDLAEQHWRTTYRKKPSANQGDYLSPLTQQRLNEVSISMLIEQLDIHIQKGLFYPQDMTKARSVKNMLNALNQP
ncbi:MAG: hypothetical protein ACPGPF_04160 [Pontibacterium sp.]